MAYKNPSDTHMNSKTIILSKIAMNTKWINNEVNQKQNCKQGCSS